MTTDRDVSVIIPALNAAETITAQIEAVLAGDGGPPAEIIVADNGSTDETRAIAAALDHRVRVVDAGQHAGSAHARNVGVAAATHDRLLFCDADDLVAPGWLDGMLSALDDHDLVGGRLDGERLNDPATAAWRPPRTTAGLSVSSGFLPFAPSGNLGVHRRVWDDLGGMNVAYRRSQDVEFSWRAQLADHDLGFAPDAVVAYRYRVRLADTFRQGAASGQATAQLYADFRGHGLAGRRWRTTLRDWAWLVARLPYLARPKTRGVWMRRAGQVVGRAQGSRRYRVRYL